MRDDSTIAPHLVLVSLALSPRGAGVAAEAQRIAALFGADLTCVHAGGDTPETRAELEAILHLAGVETCAIDILDSGASRAVCDVITSRGVDLVVAGALEKEGALEYYVGSVARKIARRAPCSVLLITEPKLPPEAFRLVVITIELDETSREALEFAIDLCRRDGAELHVVHEYEMIGLRQGIEGSLDIRGEEHLFDALHAEEEYRLVTFLDDFDFDGVTVRRTCVAGKKGWEASAVARRLGADLIVFPAPSRRLGIWDKLFPHDMEFALQSLPCACLLHRARRTDGEED